MPKNTDIYGFTYPCPGDLVDAAAFALLAGQIDTKLKDVDNDWLAALNRRNNDFGGAVQNIATGVDTVLTTPQYTVAESGVYLVSALVINNTTPATWNSFRARLRINATARFGITQRIKNLSQFLPEPAVPLVAVAGDVFSITVLYSGVATMDVQGFIAIKQLCRIA